MELVKTVCINLNVLLNLTKQLDAESVSVLLDRQGVL